MNIQEETIIINRAKENLQYFSEIYEAYVKDVYRYCYSILQDRTKTEDIVSNTFLNALKYLKTYEPRGKSIKCWLFTICRHEIYKNKTIPMGNIEDETSISSENDNILDILVNNEQQQQVLKLLEKIPNEGTEIIRLKIWEDLTFSEIALIMKQKESKIKMIYYRTLLKLKSAIV